MAVPPSSSLGGDHDTRLNGCLSSRCQSSNEEIWLQMAYQAWVTNAQTVLRQRREQARREQAGQLTSGELCLGDSNGEAAGQGYLMLIIPVPRR